MQHDPRRLPSHSHTTTGSQEQARMEALSGITHCFNRCIYSSLTTGGNHAPINQLQLC
ncbi:hypothetical protein [Xenorhabdus hominickii]|uniref:hypothetical protein n=1 Tax=Xenorhabdus hominickii TaxID=351679 RepID=UPI001474CC86|nr:hypothetical protein [Xenorhabdus hominickii]